MNPYFLKEIICHNIGINKSSLEAKTRQSDIVIGRQIFCAIMAQETNLSTQKIGNYIKRDHATVMHSIVESKGRMLYDKKFKTYFEMIERQLKNGIISIVTYEGVNDVEIIENCERQSLGIVYKGDFIKNTDKRVIITNEEKQAIDNYINSKK